MTNNIKSKSLEALKLYTQERVTEIIKNEGIKNTSEIIDLKGLNSKFNNSE